MLFIFTSLAFRILLPRTLAPFKSISEAPGAAGVDVNFPGKMCHDRFACSLGDFLKFFFKVIHSIESTCQLSQQFFWGGTLRGS